MARARMKLRAFIFPYHFPCGEKKAVVLLEKLIKDEATQLRHTAIDLKDPKKIYMYLDKRTFL